VEPVTIVAALAESADALKSALAASPGGGQRKRASRELRREAYLAFQRAAHQASVWPSWFGVLEQMARSGEISSAQILGDLSAARESAAALLGVLSQIRLVGNPEPRRLAEEITTLLVELMEQRIPGIPERSIRIGAVKWLYQKIDHDRGLKLVEDRFPGLSAFIGEGKMLIDDDIREAKAQRFNDCLMALGAWHKKFTLAARKDLGYGPRRWQAGKKARSARWQIWRPCDHWPGGWPPPDAGQLIRQASRERVPRTAIGPATTASVPNEPIAEPPVPDHGLSLLPNYVRCGSSRSSACGQAGWDNYTIL
jgi:hypothetical protein